MKAVKNIAIAVAVSAGLVGASSAIAELKQGALGYTSEGKFDVSVTVTPKIIITGLEDFIFTDVLDKELDQTRSYELCVASTIATSYKISASSLKDFALADNQKAKYIVFFAGKTEATDGDYDEISNGAPMEGLTPLTGASCAGTKNASISVKVPKENIPTKAGTYTDTVTLTVEPT